MNSLTWGIVCGALAGLVFGLAFGSTPIGIGVLVVVGATTAFLTDRWQKRRTGS